MKVTVIGSGSWGTALAQVLADNHHEVTIWGRNLDQVVDIFMYHQNEKYFPGVHFNEAIKATNDLSSCTDADMVVLAVPAAAIEEACESINHVFNSKIPIVNVAKGFHPTSHKRLSVVIRETIEPELLYDVVSLIGPSYAEEVVERLLTTVDAVCENEASSIFVQQAFSNDYFRVYRNSDVVGAEIGVAIKNVIAIASGILTGIGLGDNARAALVTRGLAEISRYGIALGAKPETFLGLTGVGDLVVTCTSVHSRNFQAGLLIGEQDSSKVFWETNTKTVEGVRTAKVIYEEAVKRGIEMPITAQVYKVLYENALPSESFLELMTHQLKSE
ncbi:MAG: NAD(P)-dependent glycerol-3-phosphate dehydrogenase [Erysipelotrichales bacterium]|nr:MAG: NAD(P)-dependent glycerol-3-phosphate dehydrogenase [Erysipelotrichales bacterium]